MVAIKRGTWFVGSKARRDFKSLINWNPFQVGFNRKQAYCTLRYDFFMSANLLIKSENQRTFSLIVEKKRRTTILFISSIIFIIYDGNSKLRNHSYSSVELKKLLMNNLE